MLTQMKGIVVKTEEGIEDQCSIEELTLNSLDASRQPLIQLKSACSECADSIESGNIQSAINEYREITQQLHDFDVFQAEICAIFNVDRSAIKDNKGNLLSLNDEFHNIQGKLLEMLKNNDLNGTAEILRGRIQETLSRFIEIMNPLKQHVQACIHAAS